MNSVCAIDYISPKTCKGCLGSYSTDTKTRKDVKFYLKGMGLTHSQGQDYSRCLDSPLVLLTLVNGCCPFCRMLSLGSLRQLFKKYGVNLALKRNDQGYPEFLIIGISEDVLEVKFRNIDELQITLLFEQ